MAVVNFIVAVVICFSNIFVVVVVVFIVIVIIVVWLSSKAPLLNNQRGHMLVGRVMSGSVFCGCFFSYYEIINRILLLFL